MKSIVKNPAINAACVSLFSAFYAIIFIATSGHVEFVSLLYYSRVARVHSFWTSWSGFLASGYHAYIAYVLVALTMLTVLMLLLRRRPYDEYHTSILIQCLAVAAVLTLIAIAVFYLMILSDHNGIVEKYTLFVVVHWAAVVLADLAFVLVCRWR